MTIDEEMKIIWPVSLKFMVRPHLVWTGGMPASEKVIGVWRASPSLSERSKTGV